MHLEVKNIHPCASSELRDYINDAIEEIFDRVSIDLRDFTCNVNFSHAGRRIKCHISIHSANKTYVSEATNDNQSIAFQDALEKIDHQIKKHNHN